MWQSGLFFVLAWGFCALILGLSTSAEYGWAMFASALLLMWAYHLYCLIRLVRWAREPVGTAVPKGRGLWDKVFADLSRYLREVVKQRDQLSETVERFRSVTEAMPDGVMVLSKDKTIEWLNKASQQHFDLHADDIGLILTSLVRQPDFVHYLEAGDYREPLVFHPLRMEGHTLAVQVLHFGRERRMVLTRDVTQLEHLETMRRDFVANVSHELKTPLTVVRGFLETLEDGLEDIPAYEARRYLHMAADQSERMSRLVADLLTLSALESGQPLPPDEEVAVTTLMDKVLQEAEVLSNGRHHIHIETREPAILLGCARELYSVFANFAVNAVRYTPEDGHIVLGWERRADAGVFYVRDDGIGIAADHIPRLTERFYRVDRGRSRETGGTGLGLAIVKHVLSRHQARLEVVSEVGKGSTFKACFPLSRVL